MRMLSGKWMALAAMALAPAGCASSASDTGAVGGRCNDAALGWAIGQPGNEANLGRLWKESGAGLMNPIAPTTVVKRDSRPDRLRVYLDKDNVITAARCE